VSEISTPCLSVASLEEGNRAHELAAIVALVRSSVIPAYKIAAVVEEIGSAVQCVKLSQSDRLVSPQLMVQDIVGAVEDDDIPKAIGDVRSWLERQLDVRSVLDDTYPVALREIYNHPPLMFVRGHWPPVGPPAVAIVGARAASPEGLKRAGRLATELSAEGFHILSGLAKGIDSAAHRAAQKAGGQTSAVMGTGIDMVYPAQNRRLAEDILANGGALLSQFFPHQHPQQWTFPQRNIVMSGLSLVTVVVEASETSGARQQARVALQHGRAVFILKSLYESHEWARTFVDEGVQGTRAIVLSSTSELVDALLGRDQQDVLHVA
jgi:DNA processing protein